MPAIAGIFAPQTEDMRFAEAMAEMLVHRAPESSSATWFAQDAAPRLQANPMPSTSAIPALAVLVQRPAAGADTHSHAQQRYWISFDGILYNAAALRAELELGEMADATLALAAFARWGADAFARLHGAWALAIYDHDTQTLTLARDPFGIRPLYYWNNRGKLAFASEVKALFALPEIRPRLERQAMVDFLCHGGALHFFSHVTPLPPGHAVTVSRAQPLPRPVAYAHTAGETHLLGDHDAANRLAVLLDDAVALRAIHGPVGACFTGGLASTALTTVLRRHLGDGTMLNSFTAHFPPEQDERTWLTLLNSVSHTLVNSINPLPEEFMAELDTLLWHQEQPFADLGDYTEWCVMRCAYEARTPHLLTPTGADTLFGISEPVPEAKRGLFNRLTPERALARLMPEATPATPADAIALRLHAQDRNSAVFALEAHSPFLDPRVAQFIRGLAPSQRARMGTLRRAFRDILPEPLLNREGHYRFTAPLMRWMQDAILPALMADIKQSRTPLVPIIHAGALRELATRQVNHPDAALAPLLFRLFIANRWMMRFNVAPVM